MNDELDVKQREELSPDEYLGENEENTGEDSGAQLLSPWDLVRAYREDEQVSRWEEELDLIGSHWVMLSPDDDTDSDPNMQVGRAWMWTYAGLRLCCTKYFHYRPDQDELIEKAMAYLEKDIRRFDPAQSTLSRRMKAQFSKRLMDAMRRVGGPRDRDVWRTELMQFHFECPADPLERDQWCDRLTERVFRFYRSRVESRLRDRAQRQAAMADLKKTLMEFVPQTMSLVQLTTQWAERVLGGDRPDRSVVSLDVPVGEDGDGTLLDLIPGHGDQPGRKTAAQQQLAQRRLAGSAMELMAAELNFQLLMDPDAIRCNENHRFSRMCYTERMAYFALTDAMPSFNKKDMYNALFPRYLTYFSEMPPRTGGLSLEGLRLRTQEEILDPGSSPERWVTEVAFKGKNMYLPSFVPRTFLERGYDQKISDSGISKKRSDFHAQLGRNLSARYSEDQIREIWFEDWEE